VGSGAVRFEFPAHFNTIHAGHLNINNSNIQSVLNSNIQSLFGVQGSNNFAVRAVLGNKLLYYKEIIRFVINCQQYEFFHYQEAPLFQ